MPHTLGEQGVTAEQIPALPNTIEQNKGHRIDDLVHLSLDDIRTLYEVCL